MPAGARQEPASFWHTWPGEQAAKPRASSLLRVNSSPVGSWQPPPLPFPPPLPHEPHPGREGVPTCWRSFHPTPVPTVWVCGGGSGGPQRIFVLQSPPLPLAGAGKVPGFLECEAPIPTTPPRCLCHAISGLTPASQSQGSLGADSALKGPSWLSFPPAERKRCSSKVPGGRKQISTKHLT